MDLKNNISIIIPVYNASEFVTTAVESALSQPETKEVILIEDGSKDNSLQVCKQLSQQYSSVKLLTHPGNCNKGAGISRNVGIVEAQADFIAFLDADDFFLPDRFRAEREIFIDKPETDGVYGALGFHYYSEEGKKKYKKKGFKELTTIPGKVPPAELFFSLLWLHEKVNGHFHLDALTIKRNVFFGKTEMFNNLRLHEDTVFIIQLSLNCNLEAGIINEPIGMRGVHDNNRIVNWTEKSDSQMLQWKSLYIWAKESLENEQVISLFRNLMFKEKILNANSFKSFFLLFWYALINKKFIKQSVFFNSSCLHVFGKKYGWYVINLKNKFIKG